MGFTLGENIKVLIMQTVMNGFNEEADVNMVRNYYFDYNFQQVSAFHTVCSETLITRLWKNLQFFHNKTLFIISGKKAHQASPECMRTIHSIELLLTKQSFILVLIRDYIMTISVFFELFLTSVYNFLPLSF